jgi:hypothetical protein
MGFSPRHALTSFCDFFRHADVRYGVLSNISRVSKRNSEIATHRCQPGNSSALITLLAKAQGSRSASHRDVQKFELREF